MAKNFLGGIFDTVFGRKDMSKEETEEERKARLKRKKKREAEQNKDKVSEDIFDDDSLLGRVKKGTSKRMKKIDDL